MEHIIDFFAGESAGAVCIEFDENFFDGIFLDEFFGEVEVAIVDAFIVGESGADPLDEGDGVEFGPPLIEAVFLFEHEYVLWNYRKADGIKYGIPT